MLEEIADLIDFYNGKNKSADYGFVNAICSLYVNEKGLNRYLEAAFTDGFTLKKRGSNYNPICRTVSVGLNERPTPEYDKTLGEQYVYFDNMKSAFMTFHELEHIDQERMYDEPETTFEHKLVKLNNYMYIYPPYVDSEGLTFLEKISGKIKSRKADRYYYRYHDIAPIERLAYIKAFELTKELSDTVSDKGFEEAHSSFVDYAHDSMDKEMRRGYILTGDRTNSPSYDYLSGIKEIRGHVIESEFSGLSESLPLRDKILYGLSLSKDEFENLDSVNSFSKTFKR